MAGIIALITWEEAVVRQQLALVAWGENDLVECVVAAMYPSATTFRNDKVGKHLPPVFDRIVLGVVWESKLDCGLCVDVCV